MESTCLRGVVPLVYVSICLWVGDCEHESMCKPYMDMKNVSLAEFLNVSKGTSIRGEVHSLNSITEQISNHYEKKKIFQCAWKRSRLSRMFSSRMARNLLRGQNTLSCSGFNLFVHVCERARKCFTLWTSADCEKRVFSMLLWQLQRMQGAKQAKLDPLWQHGVLFRAWERWAPWHRVKHKFECFGVEQGDLESGQPFVRRQGE